MESALDVLSRAATMVQDNTNETRLTSKELPTTSWRRERRLRTGEYHHPHHPHVTQSSTTSIGRDPSPNSTPPPTAHNQHSPEPSHTGSLSNTNAQLNSNAHPISIMMAAAAAASIRPFCESTNRQSSPVPHQHPALTGQIHHLGQIAHTHVMQHITTSQIDDAPLDMSYSNLKQRNSPPPPYREPLPGSNFSSSLSRPSVITQAPPKRDKDSTLILNRENDNRSSESIDEHFRRSLGNDYFALFSKNSPSSQSTKTPSPQPQNQQPPAARTRTPPPSSSDHSDLSPPPAYPSNFSPALHKKLSQQAQSAQITITPKTSNVLLTTASVTMPKHTRPSSPPLPLVVRSVMQPQHQPPLILQKTSSKAVTSPLTSPLSPASLKKFNLCNQTSVFNNSRSRTTSPLPGNQQQPLIVAQQHQQQQQSSSTTHFSVIENSPTSSPSETPPVPVPNPSTNLTAITRIKTEPGLQNVKSHNPTPPSSPTSTTNPSNTSSNYSTNTTCTPSPSSPKSSVCKPLISVTHPSAEILASVDDHFAKALGDTWKKLQESKEMRK